MMLRYKSYVANTEIDPQAGIIHGEVVNTRDVITFQADNVGDLEKEFKESVEDYLAFCSERGEAPEKPFSGRFVLRMSPDAHGRAYLAARKHHQSLNAWAAEVLEKAAKEEVAA